MYQVVLVDDEALIREGVSENVPWNDLGYELAASCENGKAALEFIRNNRVDLVLTDICMPYMDGLGLSECLYREFPQIQIIILSGYNEFDYAKRALSYQVSEYLLKPVTACELSEVLLKMKEKLDKRRRQEAHLGKISSSYHKNRLLIRSSILLGVIKGSRTEEENRKELEDASIRLDAADYCVAVMEPSFRENSAQEESEGKKESELASFVIYNVTGEIVEQHNAGEVCQEGGGRTLILFQTNKPREFRGILPQIVEEIRGQLNRIMGIRITVGTGRYVQKLSDIYISYEDALKALDYRYILGEGKTLDLQELQGRERSWDTREEEMEELKEAIRRNDSAGLEEILEQIKRHMQEASYLKNRACLYLQDMLKESARLLKAAGLEDTPDYRETERVLEKIASQNSFEDAFSILSSYCAGVAMAIDSRKNSGGKKYAMMALHFIEKNYGDSGLNLNSVCSYLNISTSRFSSIFKSATGETFMEAVVRIRMEKAKELLENTDLKNYEIAGRVGFSDPHYFSAVFKKTTGKTPTEYGKEKR